MSDSIYTVRTVRRAIPLSLYRDMVKHLVWVVSALVIAVILVTATAHYLDASLTSHYTLLVIAFSLIVGTTFVTELSNLFNLDEVKADEAPKDESIVFVRTYYRTLNFFLVASFAAFVADSLIVVSGFANDLSLIGEVIVAVFPILVGIPPVLFAAGSAGCRH